jgi:hypothetical protein
MDDFSRPYLGISTGKTAAPHIDHGECRTLGRGSRFSCSTSQRGRRNIQERERPFISNPDADSRFLMMWVERGKKFGYTVYPSQCSQSRDQDGDITIVNAKLGLHSPYSKF